MDCTPKLMPGLLLLTLPGLAEIARAVERGVSVADHLPTLARIVTQAEREHHPDIDAAALYCDAVAWLRSREGVAK